MEREIGIVLGKLERMRGEGIWPDGPRYLWTDAFGVLLLVSLHRELGEESHLDEARRVVGMVEETLGRERGFRIGEAADRDGQYFHYLAMWIFALHRLGEHDPGYRERALEVVRQVHPRFVRPGIGVYWKMEEDLSGPYPGYGLGALDPFHGLVVYRLLQEGFGEPVLEDEIAQMGELVDDSVRTLRVTQDLGIGMMLWTTHFFPEEPWAKLQRHRCLEILDDLWIDPPGYFCRQPGMPEVKLAFTNYGVSVGLQAAVGDDPRIGRLHRFFEGYRSGDEYDTDAITHVMACSSHFPGVLLAGYRPVAERA